MAIQGAALKTVLNVSVSLPVLPNWKPPPYATSSTRQPCGVFTRINASVQVSAGCPASAWVKVTGQRAEAPLALQAESFQLVAPSNMEVKRSPSIKGGESFTLAAKRASAAAPSARSLFSAGER